MARINIVNADNKIESNPRRAYFKLKNTGGPKGDTGAQGPQGPKGDTGAQGPAGLSASVTVGSTTTLAPGASATVTNSGDTRNAVLNFGIPTGAQGPQGVQGPKGDTGPEGAKGAKGDTGAAATVTVANTNTGAPGTNASVENVGNEHNAVLNFTIPRGDKGETGAQGPAGQDGKDFTPTVVTALPETGENGVLYMTEKAHTTQTATGNPITATITDGAGKIEDFQLDGDTFQQSYTGKNLFDIAELPNAFIRQGGGANAVKIDLTGGVLKLTSLYSQSNNFVAIPLRNSSGLLGKTVEISATAKLGGTSSAKIALYWASNTTVTSSIDSVATVSSDGVVSGNITIPSSFPSGATQIVFVLYASNTAEAIGTFNEYSNIQCEDGGNVTAYEPYVGGIPAPNPDYPQAVQTVTGEQTVAVTGKNLFDKDYPTEHYYYDASGNKVTDNRNDWINQAIPLSEKLTFSFASKTGSNCYVRLVELNSGAFVKRTLVSTTGTTITLDASTTDIIASVDAGPTNYFTGLQIEAGSTATAYAPYSKQTHEINLGKNLFNQNDVVNGIPSARDGSIISTSSAGRTSDYIPVMANTSYSHTGHSAGWATIAWYKADKSFIQRVDNITTTTSPSGAAYARVSCAQGNLDTCQFEAGEPTNYAPYFAPIELCKLGTYQDYIYKDGDDWKVHKATGKGRLISTDIWYASGTHTIKCLYANLSLDNIKTSVYNEISNYFTRTSAENLYQGVVAVGFAFGQDGVYLSNNDWSRDTATAFLSTNNVYVNYTLSTPTDTTITDQALIAQLEAIRTALLENGANTITNTAAGSNLAGDMEIGYYGYTPSSQYDKWLWLDVGAAGAHYEQI